LFATFFMSLSIEKKLRVTYSAPVRDCVRRLRVLPHETLQENWRAVPEPIDVREFSDDFGNRVLELRHARIEREFLFELHCEVETKASRNYQLPETGIGAFLLPSALCDLGELIRENAARFEGRKDEIAAQICGWAHGVLRYDVTISAIETTASQSLARGAGVCQDYAHLMIAVCRARALPARYVSGYMPGEGRMHAWIEVMIDNDWRAFDPTHNRVVTSNYIPVAIGRDFRDCNPHEGTFRGRATARLESGCRVVVQD
jgi:transglutaminase-like putative cysteine protease